MGRISRRPLAVALAVVLLAVPAAATAKQSRSPEPVKEPTAIGRGGAAATVDVLATAAAVDVLKRGGNAVDAAVAAAGVLGVTEPFSAGIGGGGFMVIRTAKGKVTTIDAREKAHGAMQPDSFWDNGVPLPFNEARYSGLSAGVPGTVLGWEKALDRYGTKSLRKVLEYGIDVAREGFVVDQTFFDQTRGERRLVQRRPLVGGHLPRPGRDAARRRHDLPQSRPGARVRADREARLARASTVATSPRRSSTPFGSLPSRRTRTTSGAPA